MKLSDYPNYDDLIAATGLTVDRCESFGDYQGDHVFVVRDGERRGVVVVGYGSCSGCDALEASHGDHSAMEELAWSIRRDVFWGDDDELRERLKGEKSKLSWYGSDSGYQDAVERLLSTQVSDSGGAA